MTCDGLGRLAEVEGGRCHFVANDRLVGETGRLVARVGSFNRRMKMKLFGDFGKTRKNGDGRKSCECGASVHQNTHRLPSV